MTVRLVGLAWFANCSRQIANLIRSLMFEGTWSRNLVVPSWFSEPVGVRMNNKSYLKLASDCNSERSYEKILLMAKEAMTELPLASIERASSGEMALAS